MSKSRKNQDPHFEREAAKYERPIPSREVIMDLLRSKGMPLTREQIAESLELDGEDDVEALRRRLRAMERDGQILRNRRKSYCLVDQAQLVRGRVSGHPDGFGFMIPDEGGDDLFLSGREMRAVFHGDRVVARVSGIDRRGRREGAIVEVLERAHTRLVGRFLLEGTMSFMAPENKRISQDVLIPSEERGGASYGQIVMVEILSYPTVKHEAVGKVVEVLGDHMAPGMEIDISIRSHELPVEWPPEVEKEIAGLSPQVPETAKQGREDIRNLPLVTIDGEDARDFDDAVYCEPWGKGWRLLVAIADVSSYVKPGSALDAEALARGNSVYFPERVIPMLPEILSNGLCSINPDVDRLCMVCELFITPLGGVRRYRFFEGVMRSHARLTYNKVAAMLVDRDAALRRQYEILVPHLEALYALYKVLERRRRKRGAIDFETVETRIVFGKDRKIECIVPVVRNEAHKLIEECMLAANVATADFLLKGKIPALYRIHEEPPLEKLANLHEFLGEVGLKLGGGQKPRPQHYAQLLDSIKQREDCHLIQTVMLRSLSQAVYHPDNVGHFGLSYDGYTHFTSPIRRYPDLLVHRAIKHLLSGQATSMFRYSNSDMAHFGEHCSMTERRADDATRDAVEWLKCEYMQDKVDEEFEGIITGVTGFGLFVELQDIYVEGLVHISSLANDYYHFDPARHRLLGERTSTSYRLADPIRVKVMRVDLDERKIDFELVQPQKREDKPKKKKRR